MTAPDQQDQVEADSFVRKTYRYSENEPLAREHAEIRSALAQFIADVRGNAHYPRWGAGSEEFIRNARSYATTYLGNFSDPSKPPRKLELFHGEHPHSRSDNSEYARYPDGTAEGFSGHRILVDIVIRSGNYLKDSHLSGSEIRRSAYAEIHFNGRLVYTYSGGRNPGRLAARAQDIIDQLQEGIYDLHIGEGESFPKLENRKIFYKGVPAIIERYLPDQGAVVVSPEKGHSFRPPPYLDSEEEVEDWRSEYAEFDKPDLLSQHIWWFRD